MEGARALEAEARTEAEALLLENQLIKSLKPRYGQRLMIAEIAKVRGTIKTDDEGKRLGDPAVVAVEAGTGTGKTVAYSLATIPTAKAAGKRLVIATATVALQEQLVHKDLPALVAQFEPIRSDWGHLSAVALILGLAAAFMGVALGRRKPRV